MNEVENPGETKKEIFDGVLTSTKADTSKVYSFPEGFMFGVATSAYQTEGAWNEDGKGPSIWDTLCHEKGHLISDGTTGDTVCDSYHKYKEDVRCMKQLGVQFYRFSFSWPRILPNGRLNNINQAGIDFYNNLIDEMVANNVKPLGTMYHWDLPQALQDLGGWPNPILVDYFEDYARLLYENFGDRVKYWLTFNEPFVFTTGYESSVGMAPAVDAAGFGKYLATHTLLKAHARAYHLYNNEFRATQQGKVGISLSSSWAQPFDENSNEHLEASERGFQFEVGIYANPIFSTEGDYPQLIKDRVAEQSKKDGLRTSRLPSFTEDEVRYIRGTFDFFGLNHYGAYYPIPSERNDYTIAFNKDSKFQPMTDPLWPSASSFWLKVVPHGFRNILVKIAKRYNNPPLIVTECGYSDTGELNDVNRINFFTSYLTEMLKAIHEDGCNVKGFFAWTLIDNFEWNAGFTERFGLHYMDNNDPERKRIPKESSRVYAEIVKTKQIPERYREQADKFSAFIKPLHTNDVEKLLLHLT